MTSPRSAAAESADVSQPRRRAAPASRVFCFSVQAVAAPGVMPRVLELFAKRNLVPGRWVSDVTPGPGGVSRGAPAVQCIDIQCPGLTPTLCDYMARCMREIHGVGTVLTSEKVAQPAGPGHLRA